MWAGVTPYNMGRRGRLRTAEAIIAQGNDVMRKIGWSDLAGTQPAEARVLIVDDDEQIRRGLERLVKSFGYRVKTAGSSEEADHWLGSERFSVVLLDIELPRMNGIEFLRWALNRDPELAIIMVTGLDNPTLAIECIDEGARTYLVKPIDLEFLRVALRDAVAMRRILVERNQAISA